MPKPIIILPDTSPLIHLAGGNALLLLNRMGRVIVPDVVAIEATRIIDKPWAQEIASWLATSGAEFVGTETGSLYQLALERGLRPPRHAGELSIIEWLRDHLEAEGAAALVVYEDARIERMIAQEAFHADIAAVTTHSFLEIAEESGMIESAEAAWQAITEASPTVRKASIRSGPKPT